MHRRRAGPAMHSPRIRRRRRGNLAGAWRRVREPRFDGGAGGGSMLRVLGSPRRFCDRTTRRDLLTAGAISLFGGMTLPNLAAAEERVRQAARVHPGPAAGGRARSVILLYLMGGPPHQDMFDLKPD